MYGCNESDKGGRLIQQQHAVRQVGGCSSISPNAAWLLPRAVLVAGLVCTAYGACRSLH